MSLDSPPIPGISPEQRWENRDYDVSDFDIGAAARVYVRAPRVNRRRAIKAARKAMRPRRKAANPDVIPAGWYRPQTNVVDLFRKKKGRDPDEGELGRLRYIVKYTKQAFPAANESTLEMGYQMLAHFLRTGSLPNKRQQAALSARAMATVQAHIHAYHEAHGGIFSHINPIKAITSAAKWAGRGLGAVAHAAGAAIHAASDVVGHIPIVGSPLAHVLDAANPLAVVERIAKGERIDQAVIGDIKNKLAVVKEVAPYAATVASLVPGVGSGVAAALSAAAALADGRSITDAVVAGVKDALPGGPAARAAFEVAHQLADGKRIDAALIAAAREQVPAAARGAFDTGIAIAHGRNIQNAVVDGLKNVAADQLKGLAKEGAQLVKGARTIVDAGGKVVARANALIPDTQRAALARARAILPHQERMGFNMAVGVMSRSGVTPRAMLAIRSRLSPNAQKGFDKALVVRTKQGQKTARRIVKQVNRGVSGTLVIRSADKQKNGRLITGRFRAARPGQGTQGTLVVRGKQTLGWWAHAA